VSCDVCRDIEEKDGEAPPCKDERGCYIPPVGTDEQRVLEMRARLVALAPLGIGDAVLRMYEATEEDLEMLAVIEEELKFAGNGEDKG